MYIVKVLIALLFIVNNVFSQSHIIILQGTSCAGKSSICKEIQKLDDTWKIVDEDAILLNLVPHNLKNIFPEEIESISKVVPHKDIFHAIVHNQVNFFKDALESDKQKAISNINKLRKIITSDTKEMKALRDVWNTVIETQILKQIRDYGITGHNVIIDATGWLKESHINDFKKEFNVTIALAYCPFDECFNRLIERNSSINSFNEKRSFKNTFKSFKNNFYIATKQDIENINYLNQSIDTVTLEMFNKVFEKINGIITFLPNENGLSIEELNVQQLNEQKYKITKKFDANLECYIIPKSKFDIILNTNQLSLLECARNLISQTLLNDQKA